MRPVALPAGLEDKGLEIYIHKKTLRAIYNGKIYPFELLPDFIRDTFSQHMMANKQAVKSLYHDMNITDPTRMLIQYIKCNFGNFDGIADRNEDGIIVTECWDCGLRGTCPGEGKVCGRLEGKNGMLTRRETEIFFMVIDGKFDKEIATAFDVTLPTVETQLRNIREKLGVNNRIEIMKYALSRKLMII